jgi:hypothetical protein
MKRIPLLILTLFMAAIVYVSCDKQATSNQKIETLRKVVERSSTTTVNSKTDQASFK